MPEDTKQLAVAGKLQDEISQNIELRGMVIAANAKIAELQAELAKAKTGKKKHT